MNLLPLGYRTPSHGFYSGTTYRAASSIQDFEGQIGSGQEVTLQKGRAQWIKQQSQRGRDASHDDSTPYPVGVHGSSSTVMLATWLRGELHLVGHREEGLTGPSASVLFFCDSAPQEALPGIQTVCVCVCCVHTRKRKVRTNTCGHTGHAPHSIRASGIRHPVLSPSSGQLLRPKPF